MEFRGAGEDFAISGSASSTKQLVQGARPAAMESYFSSLKTDRRANKIYRAHQARAGVFDDIERFHNPKRRHSTIGCLSPVEFKMKAG